jgi:hypothetical protein
VCVCVCVYVSQKVLPGAPGYILSVLTFNPSEHAIHWTFLCKKINEMTNVAVSWSSALLSVVLEGDVDSGLIVQNALRE